MKQASVAVAGFRGGGGSALAAGALMGVCVVVFGLLGGCQSAAFVAYAVAGDNPKVKVEAEYEGLEGQRVAVLVNADPALLYRQPNAQLEVSTAVSRAIAANVEGVTVIDPADLVAFQQRNIYWSTATYGRLAKRLNVSRIVMIELREYRLHDPGNTVMYRGVASARVEVAEADGETPDTPVYATEVAVAYPPERAEGVPNANPTTIKKGMLDLFTLAAAGKFYDHKEPRE